LLDAYVYHPPARVLASCPIAQGFTSWVRTTPGSIASAVCSRARGFRVIAPFLPAFVELSVEPSAADDLGCVRA
jgi:hypothetical protein